MPVPRSLTCLGLALAIAGVSTVDAGAARPPAKRKRDVTITYDHPCGVYHNSPAAAGPGASYCDDQSVAPSKDETYLSVSVTDTSGKPVPVMFQEDNGQTQNDLPVTIVCGTAKNIKVHKGSTYTLHPALSAGDAACPTPATSGTIKVTLSTYKL